MSTLFLFGIGAQLYKIGLAIGVNIGGDYAKRSKNNCFVIDNADEAIAKMV